MVTKLDAIFGVVILDPPKPYASVAVKYGFRMIVDPSLAPNVVEFRDSNGRVISRVVEE